jgi:DnaK suppressor protein
MEKPDPQQFRERLLALREDLENIAAASQDAVKTVELDQARVGRLSRMDAMQGQQMAQESDRRRQRQLAKIEGALRRIETRTFGVCSSCGEPIDPRRLWADPTFTRCVPCEDQ